jgi:hypothetical protein
MFRAREYMRRFYGLVVADGRLRLDSVEAARREVQWWRVHRAHQHEASVTEDDLIAALGDMCSCVYSVPPNAVREADRHRIIAMGRSDEWVAAQSDTSSHLLAAERHALVASHSAGLDAVAPAIAMPLARAGEQLIRCARDLMRSGMSGVDMRAARHTVVIFTTSFRWGGGQLSRCRNEAVGIDGRRAPVRGSACRPRSRSRDRFLLILSGAALTTTAEGSVPPRPAARCCRVLVG